MDEYEDMSFKAHQMKDRNLLASGRTNQLALTYTGCLNGPGGAAGFSSSRLSMYQHTQDVRRVWEATAGFS